MRVSALTVLLVGLIIKTAVSETVYLSNSEGQIYRLNDPLNVDEMPEMIMSTGLGIADIGYVNDENGDGVLLAIGHDALYKLDLSDRSVSLLGSLGITDGGWFERDLPAGFEIAFREGSGPVGYLGTQGAINNGDLYTIDISNGRPVYVGDIGTSVSGDIAFLSNGTAYFSSCEPTGLAIECSVNRSDSLYRVDLQTGQSTEIGLINHGGVWGLTSWQGEDQVEHLLGFSGNGILELNTATGFGRLIRRLPELGAITGATSSRLVSLPPIAPINVPLPPLNPNAKNLVLISNGAQAWLPGLTDSTWIDEMSTRIRAQVPADWDVATFDLASIAGNNPDRVLLTAADIGQDWGKQLASQDYDSVQVITYSAGGTLGSELIKVLEEISPDTVTHLTGLELYVNSVDLANEMGKTADFFDNYFFSGDITGAETEVPLPGAFNVEISELARGLLVLAHSWVRDQYDKTVSNQMALMGLGWPLSRAASEEIDWLNYPAGELIELQRNGERRIVPHLQAGDADQDLDFDQLDLVKVQVAAKYLTQQPATWGEGDWNGAPGGWSNYPPRGDGFFDQEDIIVALQAGMYLRGSYAAGTIVPEPNTRVVWLVLIFFGMICFSRYINRID